MELGTSRQLLGLLALAASMSGGCPDSAGVADAGTDAVDAAVAADALTSADAPNAPDGAAPDGAALDASAPDAVPGTADAAPPADALVGCSADVECGLHEVCDIGVPGGACVCGAGYSHTGLGCVFAGLPANPGFDATPVIWEATGGVSILPNTTDFGQIEPGVADWSAQAVCNVGGVRQTIDLAPYDRAEPLVARLTYRSFTTQANSKVEAMFALDGAWSAPTENVDLPFQEHVVCVGDAAYGGPRLLEIGPEGDAPSCGNGSDTTFGIDHFSIEVPPLGMQCPAPGEALNGDFEDVGSWDFLSGGGGPTIVAGAGVGGSRGLVFQWAGPFCILQRATGSLSVPRAIASPALQVAWKGDAGVQLSVGLGERELGSLVADGTAIYQTSRVCLPTWTRGVVQPLRFDARYLGDCTAGLKISLDDLEIVSEPSCGSEIADPGFERAAVADAQQRDWHTPVYASVEFLSNAAEAHTGNGVVKASIDNTCAAAHSLETWVRVPPPAGSNGPALRFWLRAPPNLATNMTVVSPAATATNATPVAESEMWTQHQVCFEPGWAGRPARVSFKLASVGGLCEVLQPAASMFLDDIEVTTSSDCPAP